MQAREKQIARLTREEKLGALSFKLASGKTRSMAALRGSARVVLVAGTQAQVAAALAAAEPFKWVCVVVAVVVWGAGPRHLMCAAGLAFFGWCVAVAVDGLQACLDPRAGLGAAACNLTGGHPGRAGK